MKQCYKCRNYKEYSEFSKNKDRKDGYDPCCKQCKNYYLKERYHNDSSVKKRNTHLHRSYVVRNRDYVYNILQSARCVDCGDSRWQVLEFDHVRGNKTLGICDMIRNGNSISIIQTEIDKCEMRCANCHRLKTANQFGFRLES